MNIVSFMLRTILKFQAIYHLLKDAMLCTYWELGDTKNYKKALLSQRWLRNAPYISYFVHACLWPLYFARILILNEFKLHKFCLFLQEWRFRRSRSSEVIDFGANQKHVCDFLLVRNSNIAPILHHFGDITAFMCSWTHLYSTVILGCFHCTRSPMLGSASAWALSYSAVELFSKNSKSTYVSTVQVGLPEVRHRQTDRRYTESIPRCA